MKRKKKEKKRRGKAEMKIKQKKRGIGLGMQTVAHGEQRHNCGCAAVEGNEFNSTLKKQQHKENNAERGTKAGKICQSDKHK